MSLRRSTQTGVAGVTAGAAERWGRLRTLTYWLAIAFIFMVPWEAAIHVGSFGRLTKALGLTVGAVWVILVVERRSMRPPLSLHRAFFVFLAWSALTVAWSLDPRHTLGASLTYLQVLILLLMLWDLFDTDDSIVAGLQAYVLGAYVAAASVISNFITSPEARFPRHQRFSALGYEVDGIALIVAIAAPAALYLAVGPAAKQRSNVWMLLNSAYVPIALFALALTGTRGAVLASIPTLVFALRTLWGASGARRLVAATALAAAVLIVGWFAPPEMLHRIATAAGEVTGTEQAGSGWGQGDIGGRADIWAQSLGAFSERPLGGVGLGAHREAVRVGKEAHNTYLSVLTETGAVGFLAFLVVLVAIWNRVRLHRGWNRWYWFSQLAVIAIGAMSLSLEDSKSVWIFVALALASTATRNAVAVPARPNGGRPIRAPERRIRVDGRSSG